MGKSSHLANLHLVPLMVNHHSFARLLSNSAFDVEVRLQMKYCNRKRPPRLSLLLRCGLSDTKLALFQTEDSVGGPQIVSVASQRASRGVVRLGWKGTKL